MDLPVAIRLLDLNTLRLKVDPLNPLAALPEDGHVREVI
jgi:hypothetical protein